MKENLSISLSCAPDCPVAKLSAHSTDKASELKSLDEDRAGVHVLFQALELGNKWLRNQPWARPQFTWIRS